LRSTILGANRRFVSSILFALLFTFVGIVIASMLDLPATPVAKDRPDLLDPAPANNRPADFSTPFINVVAKSRDAVVNIMAESESSYHGRTLDDYFRFFGLNHPRTQRAYGTGFIFRDDGYILTNNHVVANADAVSVTLSDDEKYIAKVVGTDPETDLAVLKIDPTGDLPVIPFGHSDELQIGEWVVAIGNPFPQQGLDRTVTAGVVSAKGRKNLRFSDGSVLYQNYIQTDASINPGNSGGPLLNLRGEAIGVNAAISSPTGASVGIGFAIPIDFARAVVPDLIAHGKVSRGWLGVYASDLPRDMADDLHIKEPAVIFDQILRGSPAAQAGLKPRDVLVRYDGKEIKDADDFRFMVATSPVNEKVKLDLIRDGKEMTLPVTIGDRNREMQAMQSPRQLPYSDDNWLGMTVSECTPELANRFGVECPPSGGVIVVDVMPGSPAYNRNIVPGVVIAEIDKYEIKSIHDYRNAVASLKDRKKSISFIIYDTEGNTRWVGIKPNG
jgi:serine protease Do